MSARLHAPNDRGHHEDDGTEDRGYRSGRHGEPCFTLARARAEPLAIPFQKKCFFLPPCEAATENAKSPASEEAGRMIRMDQSPLRRDQIRVKPSSPSTFTSEA
ncbi:hypothetical protein AFEL58S_03532 [Afipia felis]